MEENKKDLELIAQWDFSDFIGLFAYVKGLWIWPSYIREEWEKKDKQWFVTYRISTGGHSAHEEIVSALLSNQVVSAAFYCKWERGGHYYFRINASSFGFCTVSEFARLRKVTRSLIYNNRDKYELYKVSTRVVLVNAKKFIEKNGTLEKKSSGKKKESDEQI